MSIDKAQFYTKFKKQFGKFTNSQVQGFDAFLNEWDRQKLVDLRWLAYILATVWHETGTKMQPVEEIGKGRAHDYGKKLDVGQGPGKRVPYSTPDKLFYGRGHTQNTWRTIYKRLTEAAKKEGKNWDFVNRPELLLQMEPSIWATFYAMKIGLYTGKKLSDYLSSTKNDPLNSRRIINGIDKAALIEQHYHKFLSCL